MIDLTSPGLPSWVEFYKNIGQIFEVEFICPKIIVIWSLLSKEPNIIDLDKPWSLYKRFFGIQPSMMWKEFEK